MKHCGIELLWFPGDWSSALSNMRGVMPASFAQYVVFIITQNNSLTFTKFCALVPIGHLIGILSLLRHGLLIRTERSCIG